MKTVVMLLSLVLVLVSPALAIDESGCPADKAAGQGFDPFGEFHKIIAPAWHEAWPAKDYEALLAVGPQFEQTFEKIAAMEPKFKTATRKAKFNMLREEFGTLVDSYAEACRQKDKQSVYEMLPQLHDAFEAAASSLLPVQYPELEGFIVTLDLIREEHIPANNLAGILGSTETLVTKSQGLTEETIPADLADVKAELMVQFDAVRQLVQRMKECCASKDIEALKVHADNLDQLLNNIEDKFI